MKICGCRRSCSYKAVLPLLNAPTTKKSGRGIEIEDSAGPLPRPIRLGYRVRACPRVTQPTSNMALAAESDRHADPSGGWADLLCCRGATLCYGLKADPWQDEGLLRRPLE